MSKLWGGRFEGSTDEFAEGFQSSIGFDCRMYREDILGSIAHARMLGKQGIIPKEDADKIIEGLKGILADIDAGKVDFSVHDEDIHMNVERLLTERIGDVGKKLHTGRSRNDQVATDFRLYMRRVTGETVQNLMALCNVLIDIAEDHTDTVMSAYTHLQKAQPTTLAHYMMAYFEMYYRDVLRFLDCSKRTNILPLGSGALCATTYPLDREAVAEELKMDGITRNSLDGVSDRDFALEYLSAASICMMHLSRLCEEIILFSTNEFGTLRLSDAYSTGSSIMPQKKNPDMAELIRGKTGRVYGDLMGLLTVMKGLPLAYNKDMQEDKEGVFDAVDTLNACVRVMCGMLSTAEWKKDKLRAGAGLGFTNATDAADYFVKRGMAFRDAHEVVGRLVLYCEQHGKAIDELSLEEIRQCAPEAGEDIFEAISLETCVNTRSVPGGPAPEAVQVHIRQAKLLLGEL
ncbi:MAG: argininosuccinate lyase [Christensenella sp.]|uniref:argininosuccinate lyase n=1 Tax=Christensenella sp. TaxID=1935934 RepID=UPI002B1EA40D|nr:argininosuccinate lyase [Christensenella sp.]MEA5004210.1 argininosuccinate lyase [Christensenella sp.]